MMKGPTQPALKPPPTMSVAGELYKGEPAAKVAIIEYADFQCPFCRRFESQVYPNIRDNYIRTGKLKYFHRDMPLVFHQGAMPAARAVHCASEQGKFWEMHDSLLGDASLSPADIDDRAGKLGMNVSKLDQCVSSDRFADIIQRSISEASAMQVSGASPFEAFKAAIDPLLAAAN
jgi:protein-disulfide isomerase